MTVGENGVVLTARRSRVSLRGTKVSKLFSFEEALPH